MAVRGLNFDSEATNIEDRLWAEHWIEKGMHIVYEPDASVYHYHGIHHDNTSKRLASTVNILDHIFNGKEQYSLGMIVPQDLRISAFIPVSLNRGLAKAGLQDEILKLTIQSARSSKYISDVFVLTDNSKIASFSTKIGASVPFLRDTHYSSDYIGLPEVYAYCLQELESRQILSDLIVSLEPTWPFRPPGLIDEHIMHIIKGGFDTVVSAHQVHNSIWIMKEHCAPQQITPSGMPRHLQEPVYIATAGLCCVTHSEHIRNAKLFGDNIGLVPQLDPLSKLELRNIDDVEAIKQLKYIIS